MENPKKCEGGLRLSWDLISSNGPARCGHVSVAVGRKMFIHGGKSSMNPSAKDVSNEIWVFDLATSTWTNLTSEDAPYLSQHCAALTKDEDKILLAGGWTGHHRTADVWYYSITTGSWGQMSVSGFPEGAGLSSFALVPVLPTKGSCDSFLVIGREGGLRTQRRNGNVYRLSSTHDQCHYDPLPIPTASRSGHTATALPLINGIVVLGGRDDKWMEMVSGVRLRAKGEDKQSSQASCGSEGEITVGGSVLPKMTNLKSKLKTEVDKQKKEKVEYVIDPVATLLEDTRPLVKDPKPRQRHVALAIGKDCILVHGGETFDGKAKTAVKEAYVGNWSCDTSNKSLPTITKWYQVTSPDCPHLAGHSAVIVDSDHECGEGYKRDILIYGGAKKQKASNLCYKISLVLT